MSIKLKFPEALRAIRTNERVPVIGNVSVISESEKTPGLELMGVAEIHTLIVEWAANVTCRDEGTVAEAMSSAKRKILHDMYGELRSHLIDLAWLITQEDWRDAKVKVEEILAALDGR